MEKINNERPHIKNVKIHFKTECKPVKIPLHLKNKIKEYSNFVCIRFKPFVFIIFPKSGHVNVSGICSFSNIKTALNQFNSQFETNIQEENISVDNITASGKLSKEKIRLQDLNYSSLPVTVFIRPYYFPSAIIRHIHDKNKQTHRLPSIILFTNGKYIIVGGRSVEEVEKSFQTLCVIIKTGCMMDRTDVKCVPTAD